MEGPIQALAELWAPLGDPSHRTFWPFLLSALVLAALAGGGRRLLDRRVWTHPSAVVDYQFLVLKTLARWVFLLPWGAATVALVAAVAAALDARLGAAPASGLSTTEITAVYTVSLFVVWDASRYVLHRLLHRVPALWALHQVHHSAEVLTPVTFYRTHPVEAALYRARGVLATGLVTGVFFWAFRGAASPWELLGVGAVGFVFNLLGGNLRHSHVRLSWGPVLEHVFISPAQHQLHHSVAPAHHDRNFGAWLAVWDWAFGTLALAEDGDLEFGLAPADRNHAPDDLIEALVAPVRGLGRPLAAASVLLLGIALVAPADAAEPDETTEESDEAEAEDEPDDEAEDEADDESDGEAKELDGVNVTVVGAARPVKRVAGSAHVVGEETLERRENDDIHRILAPVPGVYVREEDGFGLRPNIGLRGAASDRSAKITLMEDGILLAPAPYSAPAAYFFPLATRMVGVEVFKGPAAIRHGPNTVGGAIDMKTRPIPGTSSAALDVALGMRSTLKLHGWGGLRTDWGGLLLEGVHLTSDGFKALPGGADTGFEKTEVMFKGAVNSPYGRPFVASLELKAGWARENSNETYLGLTDADFEADPLQRYAASALGLMEWDRTQLELTWRLRMPEGVQIKITGYHHWQARSWRKFNSFRGGPAAADVLAHPDAGQAAVYSAILRGEADSSNADEALLIGTNTRTFHAYGAQLLTRWRFTGERVQSNLEVGFRLHGDRIERAHTEQPFAMTSGVLVPDGDDRPTTDNIGQALAFSAHVQEDFKIGPVRIVPGLRLEVVRTGFEHVVNPEARVVGTVPPPTTATRVTPLPGVGVHVQPTTWLAVFGGVHRGFSPVAPGQAPEVKPEASWNVELGGRFTWRDVNVELVGFFNDYSNLTGTCTFSSGCDEGLVDQQHNGGAVHVYGVEAVYDQRIRLPEDMELRPGVSYTWTGSRFRTSFRSASPHFGDVDVGDALPYVPEHQGSARLLFVHPFGDVELSLSAQSAMRDIPGQGEIDEAEKVAAHAVLDLATSLRVTRHASVYLTINNLTDARYMVSRRPLGARPGRPFHLMAGIKLAFAPRGEGIVERLRNGKLRPPQITPRGQ